MNLILLSGQSLKNKEWIEGVGCELRDLFGKTQIQYYDHWASGAEFIDLEKEQQKLIVMAEPLEPYVIFAKSAGTWLASRAMTEGKIDPEACVFVGTAIEYGRENNFPIEAWFKNLFTPTLFIQKEKDPAIFGAHLQDFLDEEQVENYQLEVIPGNDHTYDDLALIKTKVKAFLER